MRVRLRWVSAAVVCGVALVAARHAGAAEEGKKEAATQAATFEVKGMT